MQQQLLLLDDDQDNRFSQLSPSVQQSALDLMAALILHFYTSSESHDHDQPSDQ